MIVKLICLPFIGLIKGTIALLPILNVPVSGFVGLFNLLTSALNFFPLETWLLCVGSIVFWMTVQLILAVLHFIVGLLPILNIRIG